MDLCEEQFTHKCNFCEKSFFTKTILELHMKSVHEKKKCDFCDEEFASGKVLKNHVHNHHNNISFECDVCEKVFTKEELFLNFIS